MASYLKDILDQEKLPSLHNTWNSNAGATTSRKAGAWSGEDILGLRSSTSNGLYKAEGPSLFPRPPSPTQTRRGILELQDQVKTFKEEMARKDTLIQQLTSLDTATSTTKPQVKYFDHYMVDSLTSVDRHALDSTRTEMASLQVRNEKLLSQLRDIEKTLEEKDVKIRDVHNQLGTSKIGEANMLKTIQSLKQSFHGLEERTSQYESVSGRAEIAISTFQKENRDQQDKILDLESRLRKQLDEREHAESQGQNWKKKFNDLITKVSSIIGTDECSVLSHNTLETFYSKLSDVVQENAMLRGKLITMNEMLSNSEMESKASRETIMRLVSEVGREQKVSSHSSYELNTLKLERDNAVEAKKDMEREMIHLEDRLHTCQRALDSSQNELRLRDNQLSVMNRDVRESGHNIKTTHTQFFLLREQLASILSDAYHSIEPSDENIKERCRHLMVKNNEYIDQLEASEKHVRKLLNQLESQHDLHQMAMQQLKHSELKCVNYEDKLYKSEGELATGDILRSGYKSDKEKYLRCLQKLSEIMKMEKISVDIGLDLTIDALTSRAEQLVKLEADTLVERSSQVYGQQRKLKALREQLRSKDLHLDLLRKKICSLEELLHGKSDLEKERDSENMKFRKLEKIIEKYKAQMNEARLEITDLKARLLESSDLKVYTLEQKKDIETLAKEVDDLENIRLKQAQRIANLENTCKSQDQERKQKHTSSSNAVQALSSELRTTKAALTAVTDREKQLLDFRNVIARMLDLDINTLAIPDYEIISRLEKLIQAHHVTTVPHLAFAQMEDGFLSGYEEALPPRPSRTAATYARRSRDRANRQARARSVSPLRVKRDPRSY